MAQAIQWYNDSQAQVKRVYFETAATVYEGMALCYNYDSTDNWTGWGAATSGASKTEQGTTAEGEQNEGKYIRVEVPGTANFPFFAGVVAGTEKTGQTGPCELDIYIPNGAIVPVRGTDDTSAKDNLYLGNADYELTTTATDGALVAIAVEDADMSTDEGLCLAKLLDSSSSLEAARLDSIETLASDNLVAIQSVETIASDNTVAIASVETIASDNTVAIASVETIASDNTVAIASVETIASDNTVAIASVETIASDAFADASDNVIRLDSIETIASDNTVAIASVETIASDNAILASDNAVAIASIETIASDNTVAIASVETIASDNTVAIASVETIASDNAYSIDHYISDAWVAFSNAAPAATGAATDSVSSLASDLNTRMSDLNVAISDWFVTMSDAGLV